MGKHYYHAFSRKVLIFMPTASIPNGLLLRRIGKRQRRSTRNKKNTRIRRRNANRKLQIWINQNRVHINKTWTKCVVFSTPMVVCSILLIYPMLVNFIYETGGYYFGSVDQERYSIQRHARKINGRVFGRCTISFIRTTSIYFTSNSC